jgi:hypothetical protein
LSPRRNDFAGDVAEVPSGGEGAGLFFLFAGLLHLLKMFVDCCGEELHLLTGENGIDFKNNFR